MKKSRCIYLFREDLRLNDNPGLTRAVENSQDIFPLYIFDTSDVHRPLGGASRVWLHHALTALKNELGGELYVESGDPKKILAHIAQKLNVSTIFANKVYQPKYLAQDEDIKKQLEKAGVSFELCEGNHLWSPGSINKADGNPYKVFTPYFQKGCLMAPSPREPLSIPTLNIMKNHNILSRSIDSLQLLPQSSTWHFKFSDIGKKSPVDTYRCFIEERVSRYGQDRNYPHIAGTSGLSPFIRFGQLSVNQIWHDLRGGDVPGAMPFLRQLVWREFSYHLLINFPEMSKKNLQLKFDKFPWKKSSPHVLSWQNGKTGYPIIDAGMRELWKTGSMHNRVRMIVASFLVKNLLVDWRIGEAWFWDCLFDADPANNSAGWQWVAGCGADAAPYFRIFNPITQGVKFDSQGDYTKTYIPELRNLPIKYLFNPWEAPNHVLSNAGVRLGENYPMPIVDLKASRLEALEALARTK